MTETQEYQAAVRAAQEYEAMAALWRAEAGRLADACAALRLALAKCRAERDELRATVAALKGEN